MKFFAFILVSLFPAVAFAADDPALYTLLSTLIDIVAPVLMVLAGWIAWKLTKIFEAKTGYDVPANLEARLDAWAAQGVAYAEEQGRKALKANQDKLEMGAKKELALGYILDMAKTAGVPDLARDKLEKLVEAKVAMSRKE